jgi:hypothetical protein
VPHLFNTTVSQSSQQNNLNILWLNNSQPDSQKSFKKEVKTNSDFGAVISDQTIRRLTSICRLRSSVGSPSARCPLTVIESLLGRPPVSLAVVRVRGSAPLLSPPSACVETRGCHPLLSSTGLELRGSVPSLPVNLFSAHWPAKSRALPSSTRAPYRSVLSILVPCGPWHFAM